MTLNYIIPREIFASSELRKPNPYSNRRKPAITISPDVGRSEIFLRTEQSLRNREGLVTAVAMVSVL